MCRVGLFLIPLPRIMSKIVILGTAHPYRGGIAAFNERLARQLQDEGHEVSIITFTLQYPGLLFPGKTQYTTDPAPEDLHIERGVNSVSPLNWRKVGRLVNRGHYDMVVFAYWMSFFAPCYGSIARKIKNAKCVALIHNMMPHEGSLLDRLLTPFFVKSMDGFVALSKSVMNEVAKLDKHSKPKAWAPHPIYDHYGPREPREVALEHLGLDKNFRYLLFFGLVRAYKGLDWLLEAFADERLRAYPLKLLVVGEFYDDKALYLEQIQTLGLQDKVVVVDQFIPDDKVKDYFNACDIVVQPYKSATQSGVTQVAYHFEKPMLVTNVGGLDEIVPNGKVGYAVDPNPNSIADALDDFFSNHQMSGFEARIKEEKKKYSWARMTETIMSVFHSCNNKSDH